MSIPAIALTPTERRILEWIRAHPGHSRADIARLFNISKAMLSKAVGRFLDHGLVTERREDGPAQGRGQPALLLDIVPDAVIGIGIELTTRSLDAVALNLDCKILARQIVEPPPEYDLETVLPIIEASIEAMMSKAGRRDSMIAGIGFAVPGILDRQGRISELTPTQRHIPFQALSDALRARQGAPVYMENDGPAYAEAIAPRAPRDSLFFLTIDHGIGAKIVTGRRLYRGGFNQAGNIGGMLPEPGPRPTLTDLASHLGLTLSDLTDTFLQNLLDERPPELVDWLDRRGPLLSEALSAVVQLLNPEAIIVGGAFPPGYYHEFIARLSLDKYDVPGRMAITKPTMRVASLTGPAARAAASATIPILHLLTGEV
ncbi:MAG: ROK family transcriptional regulator [Pseudomonadota bacterium]